MMYFETETHAMPTPPVAPTYVTAIGAFDALVVN
jgi:hypothetical protein